MKQFLLFLLIFILANVANAQTSANTLQPPPDLKIVKPGWRAISCRCTIGPGYSTYSVPVTEAVAMGNPAAMNVTSNGRVTYSAPSGDRWSTTKWVPFDSKALVILQNTGAKTVHALYLDFIFMDPKTQIEFLRYQFRSKKNILPGETKKLSQEIFEREGENRKFYIPAKPKSELISRADGSLLKVVLNRIEYSDGSVWQQP